MLEVGLDRYLFYPAGAIAVALVAISRDGSQCSTWMWCAASLFGLVFVGRVIFASQHHVDREWGGDFRLCWNAGSELWANRDPYQLTGFRPPNDKIRAFVYPPTALPLIAIFALAPRRTSKLLWSAFNVVISLSLGLLARRVLIAQDCGREQIVTAPTAALITAPMLLSQGSFFAIDAGQFVFLEALALFIAHEAQGRAPTRIRSAKPSLAAMLA
jgi:Glycosyltransferase family 87